MIQREADPADSTSVMRLVIAKQLSNVFVAWLFALAMVVVLPGHAQILQGQWVDQSEAAIDKHRKTDVAVIVLDEDDKALHGVAVQVEQLRHDFVIGLTIPSNRMPPSDLAQLPVYRCFNALSMDRINDWSDKADSSLPPASQVYQRWARAIDPIHTAFGKVLSVDPAMNADELSLLEPKDLHDVMMARVDYATELEPAPDHFDLYSDLLHRNMIEHKLGHGMVHRLFERARANRPDAQLALRVRDAISLQRGREMLGTIQKLEIRQVGFNAVTIEQRFNGNVNPHSVGRMFDDYLGKLDVPVTFAGLEAGGGTAIAAGLNLETVLRQLFAQPSVQGIILAGLLGDELQEANAGLIDASGELTPAGETFDGLFGDHWWSNEQLKTDERGNAQARVFTGWYRVTATLPNGKQITTRAYVPKSDRQRLIVLQATHIDQPQGDQVSTE